MLIPTFVWEAGRTNRPFPEGGWNKRGEEKGLQCSNSWTTVWECTKMFVWTLSFPLWTSKAIKAEAINAVWWLLLLFFFFNYCSMYKFSEHISTLNFCVKPEFHPGTSVWIVIKPIRSFNARSWAVSSPDYRMMLFPNPAVSSSARLLSWCCLCLSWRGCNSQEVGGVFSWPLSGAFKMKAWREDRRQLIIIWSPKKWNTANQWDFHLWFCCVQELYWYSW